MSGNSSARTVQKSYLPVMTWSLSQFFELEALINSLTDIESWQRLAFKMMQSTYYCYSLLRQSWNNQAFQQIAQRKVFVSSESMDKPVALVFDLKNSFKWCYDAVQNEQLFVAWMNVWLCWLDSGQGGFFTNFLMFLEDCNWKNFHVAQ